VMILDGQMQVSHSETEYGLELEPGSVLDGFEDRQDALESQLLYGGKLVKRTVYVGEWSPAEDWEGCLGA
jgi:hypothetical protein